MTPYTFHMYQALARQPMTSAQAAKALGWPIKRAYSVIAQLCATGVAVRVANAVQGYVYGVDA